MSPKARLHSGPYLYVERQKAWFDTPLPRDYRLRRNRVVHNHLAPEVGTLGDKLLVQGVILINFLSNRVIEVENLGGTEAVVDDLTLFRTGRNAHVDTAYRFNFTQSANAGEELGKILFRIGILQPEENMVDKFGGSLGVSHRESHAVRRSIAPQK